MTVSFTSEYKIVIKRASGFDTAMRQFRHLSGYFQMI